MPRSRGTVRLRTARIGPATRLSVLGQSGCLKCLIPRGRGGALQGILANTSGGLTSGDRLRVEARAGGHVVLATQVCERLYRAPSGPARLDVSLRVDSGGRIDWLPQETIAYDGGALHRTIEAEVAEDGALLLCEAVILGRAARGEVVRALDLSERWRIRRAGRLVHAEAQRLGAPGDLRAPSLLGNAGAFATILYLGPDADRRLPAMRAALGRAHAGIGAWDGKALARILAPDGRALRRALIPLLSTFGALPRVWTL